MKASGKTKGSSVLKKGSKGTHRTSRVKNKEGKTTVRESVIDESILNQTLLSQSIMSNLTMASI